MEEVVSKTQSDPQHFLVVGCGFIGERIGLTLAHEGRDVSVLTRSEGPRTHAVEKAGALVTIGNASDAGAASRALEGVDHVVYAAGGLLPAESVAAPAADAALSLEPLLAVLEALRERPGVGVTFFSSGGTVYGNPKRLPANEDDPTEPLTAYGISKLACEKYLAMYATLYGVPVRILRCSNVYGEGQRSDRMQGAVAVFLERMVSGQPLIIWGDGLTVRDYVHIDDVVDATLRLVAYRGGPMVVNVGSGKGHTVLELIELLSSTTGIAPVLQFAPSRGFDVRSIVLDIGRLRSLIAYQPRELSAGLAQTWTARTNANVTARDSSPGRRSSY